MDKYIIFRMDISYLMLDIIDISYILLNKFMNNISKYFL